MIPKNFTLVTPENIENVGLHPNIKKFVYWCFEAETIDTTFAVDENNMLYSKVPEILGGGWHAVKISDPDNYDVEAVKKIYYGLN